MTAQSVRTIGFARYRKHPDANTEALVDACRTWRHDFLDQQPGILAHRLLGNLHGHFADVIMAESRESFESMAKAHPEAPSSKTMFALLDPSSIVLRTNDILGGELPVPTDFSCVEYGTFSPKADRALTDTEVIEASAEVERDYLSRHADGRGHVVARVDTQTYAEIAFVRTLGSARAICGGYVDDPACANLLGLFDPDSVDLDFWYVLA
ncbi:MAG: hypothetical protein ACRBN8_08975 [Nannocystales bacterium]